MVGFYARFIPDFSMKAAPLHSLKGEGIQFKWGEEHQASFDMLKKALCEASLLPVPNFEKDFVLATDACDIAVSAVLNLRVNGELAPVVYYSKLLSLVERRYSTYEKECLALVCQMKTLSSKGKGMSQKLELKWSKPMVIVKFSKPNVVQLAVAESGISARKAHVSQIKKYYLSVG
jgi:hypothetical protein